MRSTASIKKLVSIALLCLVPVRAWSAEAQIAVAANFAEPIKAIAAELQRASGHTLRVTLGATGKLYAQIKNGAPFDAMLAANTEVPLALEASGLAVADSRFNYAIGQLVLWSADPNRVDSQGAVLRRPDLGKVAYANPKTAPYGAAALQILGSMKLLDSIQGQLIQGESIGQTYAFVYTGNAEVGFVALSQVMENGKLKSGSMWQPPQQLYAPIRQEAILLRRGADNPAAQALLQLLKSPKGQQLISRFGYTH